MKQTYFVCITANVFHLHHRERISSASLLPQYFICIIAAVFRQPILSVSANALSHLQLYINLSISRFTGAGCHIISFFLLDCYYWSNVSLGTRIWSLDLSISFISGFCSLCDDENLWELLSLFLSLKHHIFLLTWPPCKIFLRNILSWYEPWLV
jgi:hypothetical protein